MEGTALFNLKTLKKTTPTTLEVEIERVLSELKDLSPADDNYAAVADQLTKLYKLKEIDSKKRVSPDVLATAATNIVGIALVLGWEHAHPITSKAFNWIVKAVK